MSSVNHSLSVEIKSIMKGSNNNITHLINKIEVVADSGVLTEGKEYSISKNTIKFSSLVRQRPICRP